MTRRSMPPSFHANLFALAPARSYDPIRCQEPQWPRRPLAIGRRGLPLNSSRSAPGMSSTPSAQSHIRGYRSGGPQSSPSAGVPQVCRRECGDRRAHSENGGIPEGCPARRDGGYVYSPAPPAHRAEGPQPPHELGGGGGVRLRLGHAPPEHPLASPEQALGPLPPVHPYLERDSGALGHQLGLVPGLGVAPGPLDRQPVSATVKTTILINAQ